MKVFDFGNNYGTQLNQITQRDQNISLINPESRIIPDSQINLDSRINSSIQINSLIQTTFNIPLTRPTKIIQLTR